MRAEVTKGYQEEGGAQYAKGQVVKGATAKYLVAKKVAELRADPKITMAKMTRTALGVAEGTVIRGEDAEIAIKGGVAEELSPGDAPRKARPNLGHKATITGKRRSE